MILSSTPKPAGGIDFVGMYQGASTIGQAVLLLLLAASLLVWIVWIAKWLQLGRLQSQHKKLEDAAALATTPDELIEVAENLRGAPGSHVIRAMAAKMQDAGATTELLSAVARRAITREEQRASSLMPTLSSIASASPFIGLFGTVVGIIIAFERIGTEKSASLAVVAPAIGEALVATAFGLVAAIPATIAYNYVDKRIGDLGDELNASADVWSEQLRPGIGQHPQIPAAAPQS